METESQNLRIRKYLESGRSITALDALHLYNCFRLGARIHNLKREGMNILSEMIEITSDGKQKRIARYKLIKL
jgi:hypothetical protein